MLTWCITCIRDEATQLPNCKASLSVMEMRNVKFVLACNSKYSLKSKWILNAKEWIVNINQWIVHIRQIVTCPSIKLLLYKERGEKQLTLCANKYKGNLLGVAVLCHLGIMTVHSLEADLILQTEHKDHRIHPVRKLKTNRKPPDLTMNNVHTLDLITTRQAAKMLHSVPYMFIYHSEKSNLFTLYNFCMLVSVSLSDRVCTEKSIQNSQTFAIWGKKATQRYATLPHVW